MSQPTSVDTTPSALELRAILQHELDYRRERRLSIVTWANTILVAITGGVIGLGLDPKTEFTDRQRFVMSAAVVILVGFSYLWWQSHRHLEVLLKERVSTYDTSWNIQLGDATREHGPLHVRGVVSVILLGLAALAAIWESVI